MLIAGIKVEHPNGYSGVLYGRSSMSIYDPQGCEVLHTGSSTVKTEKELYDVLGKVPELIKAFKGVELQEEDEDEI